jgi:hypothetical protein
MTTSTITLTICDMPHDDEVDGAMTVTVSTPDGTWDVDVCPDHGAKFLMPVITAGRQQRRARATRAATPVP